MQINSSLAALCGLAIWTSSTAAVAQFEVPLNSLAFEDKGTLDAMQPDVLRIKDTKNDVWLLKIVPQTTVKIEGEAEADYLRPGLIVQFTAEFDKKGELKEAIDEIEILPSQVRSAMGLFDANDASPDAKPVRNAGVGSFRVKGRVISYRDKELGVAAGNRKIYGAVDDEVAITFTTDDLTLPQAGDAVEVKAWYYENARPLPTFNRPGQALAEVVTITLAKPLAGTGKKVRQAPEKHTRPASKSKTSR